jgi:hypothetical protein
MAQLVMIVEVFIAQGNPHHPLHQQGFDVMLDECRIAHISEAAGQLARQSDHPVRRTEQERSGIRGHPPAVKRRHHRTAFYTCKFEQAWATLCGHRRAPPVSAKGFVAEGLSLIRTADAPILCEKCGLGQAARAASRPASVVMSPGTGITDTLVA